MVKGRFRTRDKESLLGGGKRFQDLTLKGGGEQMFVTFF